MSSLLVTSSDYGCRLFLCCVTVSVMAIVVFLIDRRGKNWQHVCGIVYCFSKKDCDDMAETLRKTCDAPPLVLLLLLLLLQV